MLQRYLDRLNQAHFKRLILISLCAAILLSGIALLGLVWACAVLGVAK